MQAQEIHSITKETQKAVLKTLCEFPSLGMEDLVLFLNSKGKKVSREEVVQVLHGISPNKNWHRASQDDIKKEVLNYLWTLENQILFLLPVKQKETTVAEFNQLRLQNKQSKAPKDLIRHIQVLLSVESKNLSKFRKFVKDLSIQNDIDPNIQSMWLFRVILSELKIESFDSNESLASCLIKGLSEKSPVLSEQVGKTVQRMAERFVEKYFAKDISLPMLRELVSNYQATYHSYEAGIERDVVANSDLPDHNKLVQEIVAQLKEAQEIVNNSHEGGFLGKLFAGKVKNRDGVIRIIDSAISLVNKLGEVNSNTNKTANEKVLIVQKLQSDYENILLVKSQLENDLYNLKESVSSLEEKNSVMQAELQDKTESLEKAHEKIAMLQQRADQLPGMEEKVKTIREELSIAKDLATRIYSRLNKIKADLFKQIPLKSKTTPEQKNGTVNNMTIHKIQQNQEPSESSANTEIISSSVN